MSVMPQEIEVWYVLPAIRRELAKAIIKLGTTQRKTAELLNINESTVSQYIKSKRAKEVLFNKTVAQEINDSAKKISKGADVMKEIQRICEVIKTTELLCKIHRHYDKGLAGTCKACRG